MESLEHRQLLSVGGVQPQMMYWLKPVTSGANAGTAPIVSTTGDYEGGGTLARPTAIPTPSCSTQVRPSGQTVKLDLYVSIVGTGADPTQDGFVSGALDIMNTPDSTTPLVGRPGPVALASAVQGARVQQGEDPRRSRLRTADPIWAAR